MNELICHLIGDYVLQNHRMALKKTSSWAWASLHVALYMLPFLLLTRSPWALLVMAGTHLVIDRFRLARYWVEFWGVGCEGWVCGKLRERKLRVVEAAATVEAHRQNILNGCSALRSMELIADAKFLRGAPYREAPEPAPAFLAVWLLIINDNCIHLLVNHLAIAYL